MKRLLLYLFRWQLSTPILAIVLHFMLEHYGNLFSTVIANLIGGLIFYQVDKHIFNSKHKYGKIEKV